MAFVDLIMKSIGGDAAQQLTNLLKIDAAKAGQILPKVTSLILAGLQQQRSQPGGEERVNNILNKYGSPDALKNIAETMKQRAGDLKVDSSLGGLLGDSGKQAAGALSKELGIEAAKADRIIPMLAPLVLGALSKARDEGGAGLKFIMGLLDKEGHADLLGNLGSLFGGGKGAGGILGKALGSLLKGDKK